MADDTPHGWSERRQRAKAQELQETKMRQLQPPELLIGSAPAFPGPHHEMEMTVGWQGPLNG